VDGGSEDLISALIHLGYQRLEGIAVDADRGSDDGALGIHLPFGVAVGSPPYTGAFFKWLTSRKRSQTGPSPYGG
jgi:hypothetical protein